MNWNKRVRQIHRWLSIAFTVAVIIVSIVVFGQEEPAVWVSLSPLLPLALLLFTGLYLFVLPYATRWRSGRRKPADADGDREGGPAQQMETR